MRTLRRQRSLPFQGKNTVKVASALVSGLHPGPDLAEQAVRQALESAGLERADNVLLFLTRDFARHAQPALVAAARAAGCLQVCGSTASGLLTGSGWLLDQPGAAALVFESDGSNEPAAAPTLSFTGHSTLPFEWQGSPPRAGLLESNAVTWSHGRITPNACAEARLPGMTGTLLRSAGLLLLGEARPIDFSQGYDIRRIDGISAADDLRRSLPAELRAQPPVHQLVALRQADEPAIAVLSINADGSVTVGEALADGEHIHWAMRHPASSEAEMRQLLQGAARPDKQPDFAIMLSCIGRGPLFYGNDDRDLLAFREQFPATPLIGAYGSGQIAPAGKRNRLFHNSVITLLFESLHV